jgi:ubiquitin carboxyl-terminal hydrolase 25/28
MFQIETALLKFDEMSGSQNGKTSVVKRCVLLASSCVYASLLPRLFYGKIRQRISLVSANLQTTSSIHEKEDLFSHLPVNVSEDGMDLYDGLSRYVDDVVEFEGKKARMEVSLVELPPLLQIQLQVKRSDEYTQLPYL